MAELARSRGLALRPHAKTHKSAAIARRQLDAGAVGLTLATVAEAEALRGHRRRRRLRGLPAVGRRRQGRPAADARGPGLPDRRDRLRRGRAGARCRRARRRRPGRGGQRPAPVRASPPELAGAVAVQAARAGLLVRGVFTFPGHSYAPGAGADARPAGGRLAAGGGRLARRPGHRGDGGQRRVHPERRGRRRHGADRAPARGLRLRRRPAVGAGHGHPRPDRPHLRGNRGQPCRRPGRAGRRQQGARRRPGALRKRLRAAARPPRRPDLAALGAPRGRRLARHPAAAAVAAGCASSPTTSAPP